MVPPLRSITHSLTVARLALICNSYSLEPPARLAGGKAGRPTTPPPLATLTPQDKAYIQPRRDSRLAVHARPPRRPERLTRAVLVPPPRQQRVQRLLIRLCHTASATLGWAVLTCRPAGGSDLKSSPVWSFCLIWLQPGPGPVFPDRHLSKTGPGPVWTGPCWSFASKQLVEPSCNQYYILMYLNLTSLHPPPPQPSPLVGFISVLSFVPPTPNLLPKATLTQ